MARGSFSGSARRGRGSSRFGYRGGSFRGGRGRGRGRGGAPAEGQPKRDDEGTQLAERFEQVRLQDEIDEKLGFARVQDGPIKEAWLVNMHPVSGTTYHQTCISNSIPDTRQGCRLARREGCSRVLLHPRRWWNVQVHVPV